VGLMFSTLPAGAAITHTTSNLNLRAGPGAYHRVKAIIAARARMNIESCGDLMHHATAEVLPLVHVTHVHKHGLINF
jgi:uncharacterized protein YraI